MNSNFPYALVSKVMSQVLLPLLVVFALPASAQTVIHCWDFNGTAPGGTFETSPIDTDNRAAGNGIITHTFSAAEDFAGDLTNLCEGSAAGASFCPQHGAVFNNNGQSFTLAFPTTCYEDIVLSFWARRTNTGFTNNTVDYSVNGGSDWTTLTTFDPVNSSVGGLETFDFTAITAANNNPDFQVRITLDGSTSTSTGSNMGNNRFDNISLTGNAIVLPVMATATSTAVCDGQSVTLNGTGAVNYTWDNSAVDGVAFVPTETTTYTVTGTDANGCAASDDITITVNDLPTVSVSANGPTTFCEGGSVTLTSTAAASYQWSAGGTGQSLVVTASDDYSVTVTDGNGCMATSATQTVTVNPLPSVSISASGATTFCEGGSVTLTSTAADSYQWSAGGTGQSLVVTASDDYSVTVTDGNGCMATSASQTVTVNPLPSVSISANGPTTLCEGGSVTLTSTAAASYQWSTGGTDQSITVTSADDYSVTVTDGNGCMATSATQTVTVNDLPTVSVSANGPTTFCEGGSVTLTSTTAASYQWSGGGTDQSLVVTASDDYSVTVTDGNGCTATSEPVTVVVNPLPVATIWANGTLVLCTGTDVTLTASGGLSYVWSTTDTDPSITVSTPDEYTVTATDGNGCVSEPASVEVTSGVAELPTIAANGALQLCAGETVQLSVLPSSEFTNFEWSNGGTGSAITVGETADYSVTMNPVSGCTQDVITVGPVSVTVSSVIPLVDENGGTLTVTNGPFTSYQWFRNGNPIPGATSASYDATVSGNYSVQVTGAASCITTSTTVEVTITGINDRSGRVALSIFPNPSASGVFQLSQVVSGKVYGAVGEEVMEFRQAATVDLSAQPNGVYFLQTVDGSVYRLAY